MNSENDVQTEILRGMWSEMKALNGRVDSVRVEMKSLNDETNRRLESFQKEVGEKLDVLTDRVDGLNDRVDGLNDRVDGLPQHVEALTSYTRTGFDTLGKRVDHLLLGEHGREHAEFRERIARLEERVLPGPR